MAFDGVLAFQGRDHITASQLGRIVEGVAGKGRYILPTLHGLKATMQTANKVRIDTGDLVIDGRVVTNEEAVDLTVESGTSGYKRNDLVVCHYRKDASTGVERFDAKVLKGTPTTGTPADPTYDAGDISAGGSEAIMPLWRIPIDGITPGTPVQVADTAQSLKSLGDSVSQRLSGPKLLWSGRCRSGSITVPGSMSYSLFAARINSDDVLFGVRLGDSTVSFTANAAWDAADAGATSMAVAGVRFMARGDTWTFGGGGRYNAGNDYSYGIGAVCSIYGIV